MPSRFLNNITVNDEYTLPPIDGDANQIVQTDGTGQLSFVDLSSINGAASNFVYFDVKNETGLPILKGKGVMAVGTDGNSGHILIDEMVADGSVESKYFLGVLEEDIPNGGFARVISFGQLSQFNTNGQNGETWADGQVLWCDPANNGDFTITEPDGPNVKIAAAFILNSSTNGKIQIRVQANEGIHDMHDTKITSQVDGDVLVWDNTTGVWFNDSTLNVDYTLSRVGIGTDSPQEKLHIYSTGAGPVRAEIESTQATDAILKYTNSIGSYATFLTQSGQFSIYDYNAASHRFYMLTNGNIGIGTTNPGAKLDVVQSTVANGLPALHLIGPNTNSGLTSSVLIIEQGDGKKITIDGNDIDVSSGDLFINDYSKEDVTFGGQIKVTGGGVGGDSYFANGSVGIGTTIPGAKLDVVGDANIGNLHTNYAGAQYNVNLGFQNYNNGFAAIATGQGTLADANHSFSMGYQSKATGIASLAGGNVSTVTALPSEAAGEASLAFGNGVKTNANANFSQAFGRQTTTGGGSTSANQAMAIGYDSTAWADNSFSGGNTSNSFGEASFAFGEGATASKGDGNIAVGIGVTTPTSATAAYGVGQVAVGKYNVYNTAGVSHVFAVGAGTSDASRYNAFNVTSTGRIGINGVTNPFSILHAKLNNYATGFWMEGPANTTSFNYMAFYSGTTFKGSINPTVSGVSYGSASDYRLKENVTKLNNSTERVKKLKPSNFNFLENANETVDGFIAHEVQEIVPEAVTGKKDEVGPDGKPIYQSVDNSKIVPLLTAALQEAISKIEQLETRIQTLENK